MKRPSSLRKQRGFGLLAFVMLSGVLAFSLVVGYAGVLTRTEAANIIQKKADYLEQVEAQLESYWRQNAGSLDRLGLGNALAEDALVSQAGISLRYGLRLAISDVLTVPGEPVSYRKVLLLVPSAHIDLEDLNLGEFFTLGRTPFCQTIAEVECAQGLIRVFSSQPIQQEYTAQARGQLTRIASAAQSYFRAQMLQDPERNLSVNYFRAPSGSCGSVTGQMPCIDAYTALATLDLAGRPTPHSAAVILNLSNQDLITPWGSPVEASNLQDSESTTPPYTMSFRVRTPSGQNISIKALQLI